MKMALVWGSSSGNTEGAAELIKNELGADSLALFANIAETDVADFANYDVVIAGVSTWNTGELQEDWEEPYEKLDGINLAGTRIAVFGFGDAAGYGSNFVDALGMLYAKLVERGAEGGLGFTSTDGYEYDESLADVGEGQFCGLVLDEENQGDMSEARVSAWVAQLKGELG